MTTQRAGAADPLGAASRHFGRVRTFTIGLGPELAECRPYRTPPSALGRMLKFRFARSSIRKLHVRNRPRSGHRKRACTYQQNSPAEDSEYLNEPASADQSSKVEEPNPPLWQARTSGPEVGVTGRCAQGRNRWFGFSASAKLSCGPGLLLSGCWQSGYMRVTLQCYF